MADDSTKNGCASCLGLFVAFFIVTWAIVSCSGSSTTSSSPQSISSTDTDSAFLDGQTATLTVLAANTPCAGTKEGEDDLIQALVNKDKYGAAQALESSGGFFLQPGWKVRAIGHAGMLASTVRIRIESGPHEGDACWLPSDIQNVFKDIR